MLGLVLWCDRDAGDALIWCEDHGELASFRATGGRAEQVRAGDLVQVRLSKARGARRALELQVVARGVAADLPQRLRQTARCRTSGAAEEPGPGMAAEAASPA